MKDRLRSIWQDNGPAIGFVALMVLWLLFRT